MEKIKVSVVGGGVVGCAVAYELVKTGLRDVFLFEKLPFLGDAQSGRCSGVVHSGVYYQQGSLKARLCVHGNKLIYSFCKENKIPCANAGKLIVAMNKEEDKTLDYYFALSKSNGVECVRKISGEEVKTYEPNISACSALLFPATGIVEPGALVAKLAKLARENGVEIMKEAEVCRIKPNENSFVVTIKRRGVEEQFETELLVNCAGLYSDEISRMVNPDSKYTVSPMRGEYFKFNRKRRPELWLNKFNIYPVPRFSDVKGKKTLVVGIHLTPTFDVSGVDTSEIGDTVIVGPEFSPSDSKDDYESNRKPVSLFLEYAKKMLHGIIEDDLQIDFAGIMANLADGSDFIIEKDKTYPNFINLVGIDSPGLTSSLAIAQYVRDLLINRVGVLKS
ncbi:MAG: NAD(P)/FAD-dependent oxidoreductase [Planctomycetota bacterium]